MTKDARFGKSWLSGLVAAGLAVALLAPPSSTNVAFAAPDNDFVPEVDYTFRDHTVDAGARIDQIMSLLTLEEKVALTAGSAAIPRLGINSARGGGGEGLHGATGVGYTVFPQPLGMSQSWDPKLYYDYGEALARESTANGGGISRLTPVLDLTRDPRYGRAYETMGEDAYLTGELGTQATLGMNQRSAEGYQLFLPNLKHPLAYNNEINRLWTNSVIPDQVTNEYYIKAFKYPISAGGAKSLMNSYPLINGKPMSVNPLQRDLLGEWTPDYPTTGHYEYVTVNDYGSGSSMWAHSQRYFEDTPNGWALGSGEGTQNGQMGWSFREFGNASNQVYEALRRGMLSEADVTETARRRITYAYMVGDLDQLELQSPHFAHIATPLAPQIAAHKDDALLSAQEQIVLLKNDGALPLAGASTTKAVLLGSMTEDVFKNHYTGTSPYIVSFKDAMQNKLGAANIVYDRAVDTVAIKASNGKYLKAANNTTWRTPGGSNAADTPVQATGEPANGTAVSATDAADKGLLFDIYDYGELDQQIRTPINDRFLQVPNSATGGHRWSLINNTNSAGERNLGGGSTYSVFQTFRLAPTPDGKYGIYQPLAGNGGNNSFSATAMAYDVDDEDLNNGTYLRLVTAAGANQNWVAADVTDQSKIGPWRAENHVDGPDIATAPFDNDPT
ncbi:MAG: hypothetical protein LBT54_05145, partial [Bifidobacteriaceae bacterium]|nr:hypothetical protein [Bifidobacteriaceae bacterium]